MALCTQKDKAIQWDAARTYAEAMGYEVSELEEFERIDHYFFKEGRVFEYAEFKRRYCPKDKYETIPVAERKATPLILKSLLYNVSCYYVVEWNEGIYRLNIETLRNLSPTVFSRKDRGLQNDSEPCFMVPTSWFEKVVSFN